MLAWGFDLQRDLLLKSAYSIPPLSFGDYLADQLISFATAVLLSWALYTGRSWARWTWVLIDASALAFLVVVFAVWQTPLSLDRWTVVLSFIAAVCLFSLVALLTPTTGQFLHEQRTRRALSTSSSAFHEGDSVKPSSSGEAGGD